ncbi:glycoside hydrolase family 2 protein [Paenibacillus daejeonensis]|uniref:glycoside hydrolase family 2 protein n=1 Tax=Paenibacillus daejeonensis TaxID=135193 RepID=UPI000376378E|nr:glycoside hydrolase family 2 [Paenibacillus daejeonensis]
MIRLFRTNEVRHIEELEGLWEFAVLGEHDEPASADYRYRLHVPGCWEVHPELLTYQGRGVYRKWIRVEEPGPLRFLFKGASHTADVYWNGQPVAHHYNAYTAFEARVAHAAPGEHELTIVVDNRFHEGSALHIANDYHTYGGLIRPVVLEHLQDILIERIQFTPDWRDSGWHADVQVTVRNLTDTLQTIRLEGSLTGERLLFTETELQPQESRTLHGHFPCPTAKDWTVESPELYLLRMQVHTDRNQPIDDLIERVGFRMVTTERERIQVNGQDLILKGFNRHEDHPAVGPTFPIPLMVNDLELMRDMGGNTVRTSHYPNDERFLDLCDEMGFYVWEENHARGLSLEQMQHPRFDAQCEQVNREMVEQHANHPSIIIWGILNECASDTEEGRLKYKSQLEQIRSLDASRPLTFASHHRSRELCFDLVDIVSFNLYPGWYGDEDPGELCDQARGWADAAGGRGKPMIMSEFGGDGYYGHRDPGRARGTEERHADIIEANLKAYTERPYISGMLIWQFCDCRVTESTGWLLSRAMTQNSKGIVDRYRRPKLAYHAVKKYYGRIGDS